MDELTGLPSRNDLGPALEAYGDDGAPAIYLNIDGFNGVSYTFGHGEGDRVLAELARWLATKAGVLGVEPFRIGGNELLLAGAGVSDDRAHAAAEEIVRGSQGLGLPYAHPMSDRTVFSLSAVVFRARAADDATYEAALDQLARTAARAKHEAGRSFGVVGTGATVDFPRRWSRPVWTGAPADAATDTNPSSE